MEQYVCREETAPQCFQYAFILPFLYVSGIFFLSHVYFEVMKTFKYTAYEMTGLYNLNKKSGDDDTHFTLHQHWPAYEIFPVLYLYFSLLLDLA